MIYGSFEIYLIAVENWEQPSRDLKSIKYDLNASTMDILHVPSGYVTCLKSKELNSKLLAMSDYGLLEISDEYRFEIDYFKMIN